MDHYSLRCEERHAKTSAPIGAWEVKPDNMTDRPTNRTTKEPTNRRTDRQGHRSLTNDKDTFKN